MYVVSLLYRILLQDLRYANPLQSSINRSKAELPPLNLEKAEIDRNFTPKKQKRSRKHSITPNYLLSIALTR